MARERLNQAAGTTAAWHEFATRVDLARTLAGEIAGRLAEAVARRGTALLAVSGGTTPAAMFGALSAEDIDWNKVIVTLIDERFVPETSPRSNAALVQRTLLQNRAKAARFVPLFQPNETVEQAAVDVSKALAGLPWPLDVAILGMGGDGHTASFFPDATNLDRLLAADNPAIVMPVHAPSAGEPRLTLSLSRIAAAEWTAVHIEGTDKKAVIEAALEPGGKRPISAVFRQGGKPIDIFWAP
jgi:6-phosphogluconolactonase